MLTVNLKINNACNVSKSLHFGDHNNINLLVLVVIKTFVKIVMSNVTTAIDQSLQSPNIIHGVNRMFPKNATKCYCFYNFNLFYSRNISLKIEFLTFLMYMFSFYFQCKKYLFYYIFKLCNHLEDL